MKCKWLRGKQQSRRYREGGPFVVLVVVVKNVLLGAQGFERSFL